MREHILLEGFFIPQCPDASARERISSGASNASSGIWAMSALWGDLPNCAKFLLCFVGSFLGLVRKRVRQGGRLAGLL